jgi:hypothetical protein
VKNLDSSIISHFAASNLTNDTSLTCLLEAHKAASLELKKAAGNAFAAFTIGTTILNSPIANAMETQPFTFSSTNVVAEKVVRQGMYQDYEVDLVQERDDARSTFKGAAETKSKKGKSILRTTSLRSSCPEKCLTLSFFR